MTTTKLTSPATPFNRYWVSLTLHSISFKTLKEHQVKLNRRELRELHRLGFYSIEKTFFCYCRTEKEIYNVCGEVLEKILSLPPSKGRRYVYRLLVMTDYQFGRLKAYDYYNLRHAVTESQFQKYSLTW